jgi:hypothetical protein
MSGVRLDVRSNIERVTAEFSAQASNAVPIATYRAINRSVDKTATETSREVRKIYNLRDRAVKQAMSKRYASRYRLFGTVTLEGARIPLVEFAARWRQGQPVGATVQVKVAGGRKPIRGAFIAAAKGGAVQVFRRVGRSRLPIRSLRSISIPQAVSNQAVQAALQTVAIDTFDKNFRQQLVFLLGY